MVGGTWYRYTDNEEEGVWRDPETGFIASKMNCPEDPNECYGVIPWYLLHEPEGGRGENCVGGLEQIDAYDLGCEQPINVVCENAITEMNLRGLCPLTIIGKKYIMAQEPFGKKRYFSGYTGWTLSFENNVWNLKHSFIKDTHAKVTETKDYPMGRKNWLIHNDACTGM